jgi:hypothetical protein
MSSGSHILALLSKHWWLNSSQGRIQDFKLGGRTKQNCTERREAQTFLGRLSPKIGKNMIFWQKIVIFHTKYPNNWKKYDFLA